MEKAMHIDSYHLELCECMCTCVRLSLWIWLRDICEQWNAKRHLLPSEEHILLCKAPSSLSGESNIHCKFTRTEPWASSSSVFLLLFVSLQSLQWLYTLKSQQSCVCKQTNKQTNKHKHVKMWAQIANDQPCLQKQSHEDVMIQWMIYELCIQSVHAAMMRFSQG